jgi:hypothetical protein
MRCCFTILLVLAAWRPLFGAEGTRFIVDDDAYSDQIVHAGLKLLHEHKLVSLDMLRSQVHTKGVTLNPASTSQEKLDPPELCDRLRQSTLAVGSFYKCPDCGEYHFSSSSGFVVGENGLVCTCCHVIMEEDEEVKESYLVAADSAGRVFPVIAVVAADTDADTCVVRVGATGLKPLPLRPGVRTGETVFCLGHPGGYFFMFTQGMVSRINRRTNADTQEADQKATHQSRPVLLLNITAEFAPGSSGAPVVDICGNVVGQVASIADAGEAAPTSEGDNQAQAPASPSVPVRFCTATEEILRLMNPNLAKESHAPVLHPAKKPKPRVRQLHP